MPGKTRPADIRVKRAYEAASADDGVRVLVDRLWPRGLRKADAAIAAWFKEIAPSTDLRRWFHRDPTRWAEFRRKYSTELSGNQALVDELISIAQRGTLTLIYSARDETHNHALVLREALERAGRRPASVGTPRTQRRVGRSRTS